MTDRHTDIASLLIDIEAALRQMQLWESEWPGEEALASVEPFCIDTLSLPQWLQFVLIPRFYALIEAEADLPVKCGVAPYAEEYFRGLEMDVAALMRALQQLDEMFG